MCIKAADANTLEREGSASSPGNNATRDPFLVVKYGGKKRKLYPLFREIRKVLQERSSF